MTLFANHREFQPGFTEGTGQRTLSKYCNQTAQSSPAAPANTGNGVSLPLIKSQAKKSRCEQRLFYMADRVGFEPTEGLTLRRFSRPVP
jgi:hypothetical protein